MNTTLTTNEGATLTFDVDPYDGHVTLTADLLDGNAGVAHFGTDVEEGLTHTLAQVERLLRANLAVAPWVNV